MYEVTFGITVGIKAEASEREGSRLLNLQSRVSFKSHEFVIFSLINEIGTLLLQGLTCFLSSSYCK